MGAFLLSSLLFFHSSAQEEFTSGFWCFLFIKMLFRCFSIISHWLLTVTHLSPSVVSSLPAPVSHSLSISLPTLFSAAHTVYCFTSVISLRSLAESGGILNHAGAALFPPNASSKMFPCACARGSTHIHISASTQNTHMLPNHACTHTLICKQQLIPRTHTHTHTQAQTCRHVKQSNQKDSGVFYCTCMAARLPPWQRAMILLIEVYSLSSIMEGTDKASTRWKPF